MNIFKNIKNFIQNFYKNLTFGVNSQHRLQSIIDYFENNKLINILINFIVNNFIIISFLVLFLLTIFNIFMFDHSFLIYLKGLKMTSFLYDLDTMEQLDLLRLLIIYFKFIEISGVFFLGFFVCFIVYNKLFLFKNNNEDNNILSKNKKNFINFFFLYIVCVTFSTGLLLLLNCFLYKKIGYIIFVELYKGINDQLLNDIKDYGNFFSINYYLLQIISTYIYLFIYYYYIQRFAKIEKINNIVKLIFYLFIIIFLILLLLFILKYVFLFKAYAMEDIALLDCQNDLRDYLNAKSKVVDCLYENAVFKELLIKQRIGLIGFNHNGINYETFCVPIEIYGKLKPYIIKGTCRFIPGPYKIECVALVQIMSGHFELISIDNEEFKCTPILNKDNANFIIKKVTTRVYNNLEKNLEKLNNDESDLN